jgi:hypothetical protein
VVVSVEEKRPLAAARAVVVESRMFDPFDPFDTYRNTSLSEAM